MRFRTEIKFNLWPINVLKVNFNLIWNVGHNVVLTYLALSARTEHKPLILNQSYTTSYYTYKSIYWQPRTVCVQSHACFGISNLNTHLQSLSFRPPEDTITQSSKKSSSGFPNNQGVIDWFIFIPPFQTQSRLSPTERYFSPTHKLDNFGLSSPAAFTSWNLINVVVG